MQDEQVRRYGLHRLRRISAVMLNGVGVSHQETA
jgi:hypothetical protein